MKLATFIHQGETHIGVLISKANQNYVLNLNRAQPALPADMIQFLQMSDAALASAKGAVAAADERDLVPLAQVTLLAPLPRPGKIICVGHNYYDHTAGGGSSLPEIPTFFAKWSNVVIGPNQPIIFPRISDQVDYEGEVAVVIGKTAKFVAEAHALEYVAGYTIFNDMTVRNYQNITSQWTLGKSFDTFGPMGPALVTADEIPNPANLELSLSVNGEERQHSNTCNLIFSIPYLISYLTQAITLEPGDLISTGTPSGTGASRKPPVFMKPGDIVTVRVDGLGELMNTVIKEPNLPN